MTARRAFAPAILFAVFLSLPATSQASIGPALGLSAIGRRARAERSAIARQAAFRRYESLRAEGPGLLVVPRPQARVPGRQRLADPRRRARQPPRPVRQSQDADDHVHGLQSGVRLRQGRGRRRGQARGARRPVLGRPRQRPRRAAVGPADEPGRNEQSVRRRGRRKGEDRRLRADDDCRLTGRTRSPTRRPRSSAFRNRCSPTRRPSASRPSPPSSTTICAARRG